MQCFSSLPFGKDLGWASCSAQNVGINATGALPNASATYSREVPFTLEDRDRIIKLKWMNVLNPSTHVLNPNSGS